MYVKLSVAQADVAATDEGIVDEVAGENVPLTTLVTSNVFPPLLKRKFEQRRHHIGTIQS